MKNFRLIKANIHKGDILLSKNTESTISSIISEVTNSKWSHSFLYIGNDKIIDSTWEGTKIRKLEDYFKPEFNLGLFRVPDITDSELDLVIKEARKYVGMDYGYLQLLWQFVLRICGKDEDPDWGLDVSPGVVCSEMIAKAYLRIGVRFKDKPVYQMEPSDFDESINTVRIA